MSHPHSTCWTVIEAAASGSVVDREDFARRYTPVLRAYLAARWRSSACLTELEDAVQEIFVECFKPGGVLVHAQRDRPGGFRAFLYGAARNIARRFESRLAGRQQQLPAACNLDQIIDSQDSLSKVFDRAWARSIFREAVRRQEQLAQSSDEAARRRVELLRLRFQENMPIRVIARSWSLDAAKLHHEYAKARQEFKTALVEVVAFHHPGTQQEIDDECANLLAMLR